MPTDSDDKPLDSGATSLSLLERVKANDSAAWTRLVNLYTPLVERWCKTWRLQPADIADLSQELFLAVAQRVGQFERQPQGSFRGWLRTITHHKVCDHWRNIRRLDEQKTGGSDAYDFLSKIEDEAPARADPTADQEEQGVLYRRALDLVLADFEERTGKAFWSVVVDGRAPGDAAADLGLSTNAVYLAKARVLARLREEFAGLISW